MFAKTRYQEQLNSEVSMSGYIPYSSHISPNTIITQEGDLMRMWKIAGIGFETADPEDIFLRKDQLNTLFRSIGSSQVSLWTHNIRRRTSDRLVSFYKNNYCQKIDDKYYDSFDGYRMMSNELYLTLIYRPTPGLVGKALLKSARRSTEDILQEQAQSLLRLDEISQQVESSLRRYGVDEKQGIQCLQTYQDDDGVYYSEMLELLNFLITGESQKVRVPNGPIHGYLGTAWVFVGTETIEIRSPTKTQFARAIDFKDYFKHTEPGILNGLMYENYEYVITQSFSFKSKKDSMTFLRNQHNQLINTEDGSATQIAEMEVATDELIQGIYAMGEYHYSLMVYGDSMEDVRQNVTSAMTIIQDQGFLAGIVATATDAAFYAQLPANWSFRPRIAVLTSKNLAGLCSFHNFRAGKRDGNPWGEALALLKTPSGQPLYFNFHSSTNDEDSFDKKVLGNTRIIGQSGAGKTVLMNFLLLLSQKYEIDAPNGFSTIFFDKDRGAELLIRSIGGSYLTIKNGQPTGFNPFQIAETEDNLLFLESLVKVLVSSDGSTVNALDEERISLAVRTTMKMPPNLRRLSVLLQNITEGTDIKERENSIAKRLSKWCVDDGFGKKGSFAWVFDNSEDKINFTTHTNYGFDGTDFLDNADVRTPIAMYLLYRMESIIDGRRFIYFMDEAWKWVDDDAFSEFAGNKQLTIRKQNGLGVFATQMPSSLLKSKIASQLVQQCATEIYLPNPKADFDEYTKGFKCTLAEFNIIRQLTDDSRMFLVKQGSQSMIARLDLADLGQELEILSGSTDNMELLDEIIEEHGEDPDVWTPIFHEKRNKRLTKKRTGK